MQVEIPADEERRHVRIGYANMRVNESGLVLGWFWKNGQQRIKLRRDYSRGWLLLGNLHESALNLNESGMKLA